MSKVGNHHKTVAFGNASEYFASKIFQMDINPNGHIRPDLVVNPDLRDYSKPFAIEVKGGKRAILLRSQLTYGINNMGDWRELFGGMKRNPFSKRGTTRLFVNEGERVWYATTQRVDGLSCDDLVGDYAMVRVQWGDVHMIPSELIFYYYAAVLSRKNHKRPKDIVKSLKHFVKRSVRAGSSLYCERDNDAWVSLPFSSSRAILEGTPEGITNEDQLETLERFFRLARDETDYDGYVKSQMRVAGDSKLVMMHSPRDRVIIDEIKSTVKSVRPKLDGIQAERDGVKLWLEEKGIKLGVRGFDHYYNGGADESRREQLLRFYGERFGIDEDRLDLLERLCKWETEREFAAKKKVAEIERANKEAGVPF